MNSAILAVLLVLASPIVHGQQAPAPADVLIRNARVYTVDASLPWAQAVAIKGERIQWVGSDSEADARVGAGTRVIDAGGRLMLPGFIDSHFHLRLGSDPDVLRFSGDSTLADMPTIQAQIRQFAEDRPELKWIEAEGWLYSPSGNLPDASQLEGLTGGRPALLVAYDYHTVWLNREAMRELGITRQTTQVAYAEHIVRDPATGEPTGVLTGFGSTGLSGDAEAELRQHVPSHSAERTALRIRTNMARATTYGITTLVDPQSYLEDLALYRRMKEHGELSARLQVALFLRRGSPDALLQEYAAARQHYDDDRLRVSAVKLYADDVIEAHTAAMLAPYADRPDEMGRTDWPVDEFNDTVARVDRLGLQAFIHAIGDRGIRMALDGLEHARGVNGARDSRHQLVHIECLSPQDIPRFKQLGVVADMQPRHSAPEITGQWAAAVGPERAKYAWALRSLRDAGAVLAFASDWNVADMDPLIGIYAAVTRKGLDGKPEGGWIPEQAIDLETAIRGYTINGAYANFVDTNRGSLTAGKYADLVLLSDDLFRIAPDRIKDARVVLTLVGGQEIYRHPSAGAAN